MTRPSPSSSPRADAVRAALTAALGRDLGPLELQPTGGGCINSAALIEASGTRYFVKWNDRPLPRQFEAEAAGLAALAAAGSSLRIPAPIAFGDEGPERSFLVLEYLAPGRRGPGFEEALGRGLAELHAAGGATRFGFALDGTCGATPQPNGWLDDWVDFYRRRRLGHQVELARGGGLGAAELRPLTALLAPGRLEELLSAGEPPALIHGDLWSGNLHVTADGAPALIDPAAYFGHREAELGMMVLFGGFGPRVLEAYEEALPLPPGWRGRLPLYSLYHVLNHYNLFGGAYGAEAAAIARRFTG